MKIIQQLNCLTTQDDFAKETSYGGIFNEIKDNINSEILAKPVRVHCSGSLCLLDKTCSHKQIWATAEEAKLTYLLDKDRALMLINKAAEPFLSVENREIVIYLQDRRYCLVAESFIRKEEGFIKRILLCKIKPDYQHFSGTAIIVA